MKLIDRYLIRMALRTFAQCLAGFSILMILYDFSDRAGEFMESGVKERLLLQYYAHLLIAASNQIVPVALLLAVLQTLYHLTRNHELTALRASGISMVRIMIPFLSLGSALSLLLTFATQFLAADAKLAMKNFISDSVRTKSMKAEERNNFTDIENAQRWGVLYDKTQGKITNITVEGATGFRLVLVNPRYRDGAWTADQYLLGPKKSHRELNPSEAGVYAAQIKRDEHYVRMRLREMETNLAFERPGTLRDWFVRQQFDPVNGIIRDTVISQRNPDGCLKYRISLAEASFGPSGWELKPGEHFEVTEFKEDGISRELVRDPDRLEHYSGLLRSFKETPQEIRDSLKPAEYLSPHKLAQRIEQFESNPVTATRLKADLHHAWAMPWACMVVALLAVPCGAQTGRKGAMAGITMVLAMLFSYYVLVNIGLYLGKSGSIPPVVAGWAPNLIFLLTGGFLVWRMR